MKVRPTCELCHYAQGDGFRGKCRGIEYVDECPTGEIPRLIGDNKKFWFLFARMLPGIMDGYGAFKFETIKYVMDEYNVEPGQRPIIHEKCLVVFSAIREIQEEEEEKRKAQNK